MVKKWTPLHLHTDESNAGGYFEIVTKSQDYVDYFSKNGYKAIAITNHGNVARWIKHKEEAEAKGLKYIHAIEAYVTMDINDNNRGYHTIIVAKNYDGVKLINKMSSVSFNRQDGHYYYRPRMVFEELEEALKSNNIYITTACLASGLWQNYKEIKAPVNKVAETLKGGSKVDELEQEWANLKKWVDLAISNKDNVFLEVQPHNNEDQKQYNELLLELHKVFGLNLIASNDIHALNERHNELRMIVKKGKNNNYSNDDEFELWFKDYDTMVNDFLKQGVLDKETIEEALDLTMKVADSVEEFVLDDSHKYPKLYDNPEKEFQKRIKQGLLDRGILKKPVEERKKYLERVNYEYGVYKQNNAIDYMLSHEDILNSARDRGINISYGRGSVSGSLIAYLCHQTEMDSVKLGLSFERFMNPARISLADIDIDMYRDDQQATQKWILTQDRWHSASIMTANTYGLKGAIKAIADGMEEYAGKPAYIQSIRNQINLDGTYPDSVYEEHKELFDNAKEIVGCIDSFGRHAAGICLATEPLDETMGYQTISGWDYPVTQVAMKEIDHYNWVKYDMLGLDNIGLISKTCELAGLPFLTPDSTDIIDFEDEKVWKSMAENNIGVFQMEGERAGKLLSDMLSDETIKKIKSSTVGKDVKYMDLLSLVNAAQRPAGSSYVNEVTHGYFKDNGHEALNKFLAPTLGQLVYQEQLIQFLVEFAGRTPAEADVIRRAIGKKVKETLEEEVPKIREDFINTMINTYNDSKEHAEKVANDFMQVFMDASNYGFSINHSMAYSYIGYISTWLRYYYPLEWSTSAFEIWKDNKEKVNRIRNYAQEHDIEIKPAKFRKSRGLYYMDKKDNNIYAGTATIKGLNAKVGDELYSLNDKEYDTFSSLLLDMYDPIKKVDFNGNIVDLKEFYRVASEEDVKEFDKKFKKSDKKVLTFCEKSLDITRTHILRLISLGYFGEFGTRQKLTKVYELFKDKYKPKAKTFKNKSMRYKEVEAFERNNEFEEYPIFHILNMENEYLGSPITTIPEADINLAFVKEIKKLSNKIKFELYSISKGTTASLYVKKAVYNEQKIEEGSIIQMNGISAKPKNVFIEGRWQPSKTDKEYWLQGCRAIYSKTNR